MLGAVHVITLLVLVAVTATAVVRDFRRPGVLRLLLAILGGLVAALFVLFLSAHACDAGTPLAQWLLPSVCLVAAIAFIKQPARRRVIALVLLVASVVLSLQYSEAVHGPRYVGHASRRLADGVHVARAEWHTWLSGLYRRVN